MNLEQALIRQLQTAGAPGLLTGIGDDAAVISKDRRRDWLVTTDMLIEGIHLKPRASVGDWAKKAAAVNLSDIAAMGGQPKFALLSVGLPAAFARREGRRLMRALEHEFEKYGVRVIGGDTCRSPHRVVSVTLMGVVNHGRAVLRSGAKEGDTLFVTGALGGSLRSGRHIRFRPRLKESEYLTRHFKVHSMIDISDGLSKDLFHLAESSRVGLRVFGESVPLHPRCSLRSAFVDGEDFELAFTLGSREAARLMRAKTGAKGFSFYPIGRVVASSEGKRLVQAGRTTSFPQAGDHHFNGC